MYYVLLSIGFIIIITVVWRIVSNSSEPDFALYGALTEEGLANRITRLANESRFYASEGKGLSLGLIQKQLKRGYKILSGKNSECLSEYEKWLYDNYYKIEETLLRQKKFLTKYKKLPHVNGLPRIYKLAELIVKCTDGGFSQQDISKLLSLYNVTTPLTFFEIMAFKYALEYSLLEYLSVFFSKSIVKNQIFKKAEKDIVKEKFNVSLIKFNSYLYRINLSDKIDFKYIVNNICISNGQSLETRANNFIRLEAFYNGCVGAAVKNLHKTVQMSDNFIIGLSALDNILKEYPLYLKDTLATRYALCYGIAKEAKKRHKSELFVARRLLDKAEISNESIEKSVLIKHKGTKLQKLYIYAFLFLTLIASIIISYLLGSYWLILPLFPLSFALIKFLQSEVFSLFLDSTFLPRIKSDNEKKTMITVTRLVKDENEIQDAFNNLSVIMAANGSDLFSYALLLDLTDSDAAVCDSDRKMLDEIQTQYEEFTGKDNVNIFLRSRILCGDGKYRGWEKKRGALLQLNDYVLNNNETPFRLILGKRIQPEYIITLDCDTFINCAAELVSIMEHPANKDINILGINMRVKNESAGATGFTLLMNGISGLDPYNLRASEVEFDLFGQGNYTGKGIYRIKAFNDKVSEIFRDERILSHDFIEGAIAGCAVCEEYGLEDFPTDFSKFLSRQLRWLRGDWQLLPYLFPKVKNKKGEKIKNPISPIAKFHIFNNMLYGLIPIVQLSLLIISIFFLSYRLIIAALALNILYILNSFRLTTLKSPIAGIAEIIRQFFSIAMLPTVAVKNLFAIIITLLRIMRGRNLLIWKTAAHFTGKINIFPNILFAAFFVYGAIYQNIFFLIFTVVFGLGIIFNLILNRKISNKEFKIKDKIYLEAVAAKTWRYFADNLTEEYHYLIPDNLNEESNVFAKRTSPTNIGFSIMAVIVAYELKFIEKQEFNKFISDIIYTLERLDKWHGHIFNWIDIKNLTPLEPRYISTIDSGNLLASLLAVKNYCDGDLKKQIEKLINDMDFSLLIDERGLLKIGYNDTEKRFDDNYYDLMGSESILTYLCTIGCGKIERSAWNNLSRQSVKYKGEMLFSWSGGMFEYLMNTLFFDYYKNTLLYKSARNVIRSQIYYAKKQKLPFWGISESQFNAYDEWGNYQYKAFGIPNIALANFKSQNVLSPYASILACGYFPDMTIKNMEKIEEIGLNGKYGFYEAWDNGKLLKSYMAHHQGMILLALGRLLKGKQIIRHFKENPEIQAVTYLLGESGEVKTKRKKEYALRSESSMPAYEIQGLSKVPYWRFYSNNKFYFACNDRGENFSCFDGIRIVAENKGGIVLCYNDKKLNILLGSNVIYDKHYTKYVYHNKEILAESKLSVLSGINGCAKKINIRNTGNTKINFKLIDTKQLCLCKHEDFIAHPVFVQQNIQTYYNESLKFMYANKKDFPLYYAYFTSDLDTTYNSNGLIERNKDIKKHFGYVLYPVAQSITSFDLEAGEAKEIWIFDLVSYDMSFITHAISLLRTPSFVNAMIGNDFSLNKIVGIDKDIAEAASLILSGRAPIALALGDLFDSSLPIICENIQFEFELGIEKNRLQQIAMLYSFGVKFNLCIIIKSSLRLKLDKLLELLNFNSLVRYGKFIILTDENVDLCEKIRKQSLKIDFNNFKNLPAPAVYNETEKEDYSSIIQSEVKYSMGIGGFNANYEYLIPLYNLPPKPWSNVIAEKDYGSVLTECGGGFTFAANSRQQKITEFFNDCIYDDPSEKLMIYRRSVNKLWSVTKKPCGAGKQWTKHCFGYSQYYTLYDDAESCLTEFICDKNKYYILDIKNTSLRTMYLDIIFACDFTLGDFTENTLSSLRSKPEQDMLYVENLSNGLFAKMCCDDAVQIIPLGNIDDVRDIPLICDDHIWLKSNTGTLIAKIEVNGNKSRRIVFSLGTNSISKDAEELLEKVKNKYKKLTLLDIKTSLPQIDAMLKWLPYQTYNSRFLAKAGFYQVSGAYGFRDQLQDSLTLLYIDPKMAKSHILTCAGRQYEAGDVQHWWHFPDNVGIRTYFCDDRLYLPWLVAEYIEFTGDKEILKERVNYLKNRKIPQGQKDLYHYAEISPVCESLEEHCLNCIYSEKFSDDGLMLIGGGDWNDAMDELGAKGRGVTVWGSMFLYFVINKFLPYVSSKSDKSKLMKLRFSLFGAVEKCWDKDRYIRAISDSGQILGSERSAECKIDLLTQSWSVISGIAPKEKADIAIEKAGELVDRENKIIKLLSPPFEKSSGIGYITKYPKGVRENGGQYTHAAVWYIISMFLSEKPEKANSLLSLINPINHSRTYSDVLKYKAEPYVLCGDVYSGENIGEGGWSWYTGASGWLYLCYIQHMMGLKIHGDTIKFEPALPDEIEVVEIGIRLPKGECLVKIDNTIKDGKWKIFIGNRMYGTDLLKMDFEVKDKIITVRRA